MMRKTSGKPRLGNILQDIWSVLLKTIKVMKNNWKDWESVTDQGRLGRCDNKVQYGTLNWILEKKEDINGKTDKIQIESGV